MEIFTGISIMKVSNILYPGYRWGLERIENMKAERRGITNTIAESLPSREHNLTSLCILNSPPKSETIPEQAPRPCVKVPLSSKLRSL